MPKASILSQPKDPTAGAILQSGTSRLTSELGNVIPTSHPDTTIPPTVEPSGSMIPTSQFDESHLQVSSINQSRSIQRAIEEGQLAYPELVFTRKEADS